MSCSIHNAKRTGIERLRSRLLLALITLIGLQWPLHIVLGSSLQLGEHCFYGLATALACWVHWRGIRLSQRNLVIGVALTHVYLVLTTLWWTPDSLTHLFFIPLAFITPYLFPVFSTQTSVLFVCLAATAYWLLAGQLTYSHPVVTVNNVTLFISILSLTYILADWHQTQAMLTQCRVNALESALMQAYPDDALACMREQEPVATQHFQDLPILIADINGFSKLCESISTESLAAHLHDFTSCLDALAARHGVTKIKTTGDSFLATLLPHRDRETLDSSRLLDFAKDVIAITQHSVTRHHTISIRIGIGTGRAFYGKVGVHRPYFDVWGPAVNLASRLEAIAPVNAINVCSELQARWSRLEDWPACSIGILKGIGQRTWYTWQSDQSTLKTQDDDAFLTF